MPRRLLAHMSNHPQPEQNPRLTRAHFLPLPASIHLLCPPDWFHKLRRTTSQEENSEHSHPPRRCARCLVCGVTQTGTRCPSPHWNKASCLQHVGMAVSDRCQHGANRCWLFQTGANTLSSLSPSASLSPSKPKCHLTFYSDNRAFQCVSATYVQKSLWTQRRVKEPGKISINKIPQWSSPELKRGYHI